MRDVVQKFKETLYEGTASYGWRFRDVADLGYPSGNHNADQHRIMKDAFLRGLMDQKLVERLVKEGRPGDFMAAITLVEQYSSDEYILRRALDGVGAEYPGTRTEEPMDVGVVAVSESAETASLRKDVDKINCHMTRMTKQVTKLCSQLESRHPRSSGRPRQGTQPNRYKFTADGVPICVHCNKPAHVIRECKEGRRPKKAMASQTDVAATHQGGQ